MFYLLEWHHFFVAVLLTVCFLFSKDYHKLVNSVAMSPTVGPNHANLLWGTSKITTNLQIPTVIGYIQLYIHHVLRTASCIHNFLDFDAYVDGLDFSNKSEEMCQFFKKRGYPDSIAPVKHMHNTLIDSQH